MLEEIRKAMSAQALKRKIDASLEIEEGANTQILADPLRARQVMLNLYGNALKFTHKGFARLGLRNHVDETGREWSILFVHDSGIGIAEEQIDKLFEAFTQADASTTRRYGGSGLGLATCQRLSEIMGGKIKVHSELGVGSTFEFWLPTQGMPDLNMTRDATGNADILTKPQNNIT